MRRVHQMILIVSTILGSWLGMQAIHEAGHVLGAWVTGGRVDRVVLNPLTMSRTDLGHNPSPLVVVWAGPVIGVIGPLTIWRIAVVLKSPGAFVFRLFAGFCLLANGSYLGVGSFLHAGDCGEIMRHGCPCWPLWVFGLITAPSGLWLWHGEGSHFGLADANGQVNVAVAYMTFACSVILLIVGFTVGGS